MSYQAHSDEQLADIFQRCERYRHRLHTATPEQQRELLVVFAAKATVKTTMIYTVRRAKLHAQLPHMDATLMRPAVPPAVP